MNHSNRPQDVPSEIRERLKAAKVPKVITHQSHPSADLISFRREPLSRIGLVPLRIPSPMALGSAMHPGG
ncbi:hypothetical protein CC2G_004101 [Coprinopsis cinerea AmutBmut pab1-1]|nr:hypothetical protein CC2G_004101 [Coprinopsis cinerea AmutBmut pab1-1]